MGDYYCATCNRWGATANHCHNCVDILRSELAETKAALVAAQERVKELERIAPKDPYEIDTGVFVPKAYRDAHEEVWRAMKTERDEANARAQEATTERDYFHRKYAEEKARAQTARRDALAPIQEAMNSAYPDNPENASFNRGSNAHKSVVYKAVQRALLNEAPSQKEEKSE